VRFLKESKMSRSVTACLLALVIPFVTGWILGLALGFVPSPMLWSRANIYSLLLTLVIGGALGALVGTRVSRSRAVAACALPWSAIVALQWWRTADPSGTVIAILSSGVLGVVLGAFVGARSLSQARIGERAA